MNIIMIPEDQHAVDSGKIPGGPGIRRRKGRYWQACDGTEENKNQQHIPPTKTP